MSSSKPMRGSCTRQQASQKRKTVPTVATATVENRTAASTSLAILRGYQ